MTRTLGTLFLFLTASTWSAADAFAQGTVIEPRSGTPFPVSLAPPGGGAAHWIMGTGLRDRTIFGIQIYAFGLYVDPDGARRTLASFAGIPASRLQRDQRFYRRVLDLDFAMTLRLVMMRTASGGDITDAFDDALRPRMTMAARARSDSADEAALQAFSSYFDVDEVTRGTAIAFSCTPDGRLTSSIDGEERPRIDSKPLCRALFDVYLGEQPISDAGKRSVIAGVPGLLDPEATP